MVSKMKNQINDIKLTSSEVVSISRTDSYSQLINESFLVTSTFEVYIHNKDNVVSVVTRVFGLDILGSIHSRSYKIFSIRSTFLAFYSLSTGGCFLMGRMTHVIG